MHRPPDRWCSISSSRWRLCPRMDSSSPASSRSLASAQLKWVSSSVIAAPRREAQIGGIALAATLAFALLTLLHVIVGELAPKNIAISRTSELDEPLLVWSRRHSDNHEQVWHPWIHQDDPQRIMFVLARGTRLLAGRRPISFRAPERRVTALTEQRVG